MRYRKLGTTDLSVSVICLGTMTFVEQNTQQDGFDQMDYALERGVIFFDTIKYSATMRRIRRNHKGSRAHKPKRP